jgi:serine/threonine protein kinase
MNMALQKIDFHKTRYRTNNFPFPFLFAFVFLLVSCFPKNGIHTLLASDRAALHRAHVIRNLDKNIGLSQSQLVAVCRFIDHVRSRRENTTRIFTHVHTGLPCIVERISANRFIIKGLPSSFSHVGHGAHKIVKKCILYGRHPKIVVSCSGDSTLKKEIGVLSKLKGCRGITPFITSSQKTRHRYEIYLDYFSEGSLGSKLDEPYQFTEKQVLRIAKDLAFGLQALQNHHLEYNILLRPISGNLFESAIVDFGQAIDARRAKKETIPSVAQHIYPPELLLNSYYKDDIYTKDVYALGCSFYRMVWGTRLPWLSLYNKNVFDTYNTSRKVKIFRTVADLYKKTKEEAIGHLLRKIQSGQSLTSYEQFQVIVLDMVSTQPNQRPKASQLVQRLKNL